MKKIKEFLQDNKKTTILAFVGSVILLAYLFWRCLYFNNLVPNKCNWICNIFYDGTIKNAQREC